jgi:hypothetical protein
VTFCSQQCRVCDLVEVTIMDNGGTLLHILIVSFTHLNFAMDVKRLLLVATLRRLNGGSAARFFQRFPVVLALLLVPSILKVRQLFSIEEKTTYLLAVLTIDPLYVIHLFFPSGIVLKIHTIFEILHFFFYSIVLNGQAKFRRSLCIFFRILSCLAATDVIDFGAKPHFLQCQMFRWIGIWASFL